MAICKKELIDHYKITLESLYHHDTINMQIYMVFGIVITLFLTGIGLFFSSDFPFKQTYIYIFLYKINIWVAITKLGIICLFGFILWYFHKAFRERAEEFNKYAGKMQKITRLIRDSDEEGRKQYEDLLFTSDLNDVKEKNKKRLRNFKIYFIIACILLAAFVFLFVRDS